MRLTVLLTLIVLTVAGSSEASFQSFDDFEDEALGPIAGQDGWVSSGGDNRVVEDPAATENQVLYVPSDSSILRKSLLGESVGVPDGTLRMVFMRMRVSSQQSFSVGLSGMTSPSEYSDFAAEIGMANSSQDLDLRVWDEDGGNYEVVTQLSPDTWYNMWVLVDAAQNHYQIWLNDVPGAGALGADKLSAPDGDETFDFRTGRDRDIVTFYIKTSGGGSGTNFGPAYFDDIHIETTPALNLTNPVESDTPTVIRALVFDHDETTLEWEAMAWADGYDIVKGDLVVLRDTAGDFALSVMSCLEDNVAEAEVQDPERPDQGAGLFYVVRGDAGSDGTGTYDTGESGQLSPRDPGIEASPAACP